MRVDAAQAVLREYRIALMALDIAQAQNAPEAEIDYERKRVANVEARLMELLILVNDVIHPQARVAVENHHVTG